MGSRIIRVCAALASVALCGPLLDALPATAASSLPNDAVLNGPVAPGTTVSVTDSATLSTEDQSMFGPGNTSAPGTLSDTFFDLSLPDSSISGGGITGFDLCSKLTAGAHSCPTEYGAQVTASASGEVGLSAQLTGGSGGTVGTKYPVKVTFTTPAPGSFAAGDPVTVKTSVAVDPTQGPAITSVFPSYSDAELDGVFGFSAGVSGEICVFACASGGFSLTVPTVSGKVFDVPSSTMSSFPGLGLTGHCFDSTDNSILGLGSVTPDQANPACTTSGGQTSNSGYVFEPHVAVATTTNPDGSLTATGSDQFMAVPVNGVKWIKRIASAGTFPSYFPNLSESIDGAGLGWTLLDTVFNTSLVAAQTFTFKPQVDVTLQFPRALRYQVQDPAGNAVGGPGTGSSATFPGGDQIVITTPHDLVGPLPITPALSMASSTFSSNTTSTVAETAHVTVGTLDFSIPSISDITLGPLYDHDFGLASHVSTLAAPSPWQLGGFNAPTLSLFDLTPDPRPVPAPVTIHPIEGAPFTGLVAGFTDPDQTENGADYTAVIAWGDTSTSTGTVSGAGGQLEVTGTHTYAEEGPYPVTVTLTDTALPTNQSVADSSASVTDAALAASPAAGSTAPGDQGVLLWPASAPSGTLATFTDADPQGTLADYSATVGWGDGTTSPGTVGVGTGAQFTVGGSHSYAQLGPYTVTVDVSDAGGATASTLTHVITYAAPAGGNFVVASPASLGSQVDFWGSQWAKNNPGSSAAPDSFKGWATSPAGPATCGASLNLSAGTGDSATPPAGVPSYMAVLVADPAQITRTGSGISGPVAGIVVIQTAPGYRSDPGHPGYGTVVAGVCGPVGQLAG